MILCALAWPAHALDQTRELAEVRDQLRALAADRARDDAALDRARDAADALARELATAHAALAALEQRIAERQTGIESLIARQQAIAARASVARRRLAEQAHAHLLLLRRSRLELLLEAATTRHRARHLACFDYLHAGLRDDAGRVDGEVATLNATKAALKLETDALRRLRQDARSSLASLAAKREARAALVAAIEQRLSDGAVRAAALERDERRLRELLGELTPAPPATTTPFSTLRGRLEWPVEGSVANVAGGTIRAGGARWAGILIETAAGAEVRAVAAGRVVFADWFRHLGQLIVVDHGDGYLSLYGNNGELLRKPGDALAAGDSIARVGDGAGELPRGLYFELRAGALPLDPAGWLSAR